MNRSVIALALAASLMFIVEGFEGAHAAKPSWAVTAADVSVSIVPGPGTGGVTPVTDEAPKPAAPQFVVKASASVDGEVKGEDIYPYAKFASEAECKAALDGGDARLKAANDGLKAAIERQVPGIVVGFTCVQAAVE